MEHEMDRADHFDEEGVEPEVKSLDFPILTNVQEYLGMDQKNEVAEISFLGSALDEGRGVRKSRGGSG